MDKEYIKRKKEEMSFKIEETKRDLEVLFKEVLEGFSKDSMEHKIVEHIYDNFKNESSYLGEGILKGIIKEVSGETKNKVEKLYELIADNGFIFKVDLDSYYADITDSDPVEFCGDIVITDPCYLIKNDNGDDWKTCDFGRKLNKLGFTAFMTRGTLYGDWECGVFDVDNRKIIGNFCADSGMVTVALLDDVRRYNPDFEKEYLEKHSGSATIIRDFKGTVKFVVRMDSFEWEGIKHESFYLEIEGRGVNMKTNTPINFLTAQTGC